MITADDERGGRKVLPAHNRQSTITDEKRSAKGLKQGTARHGREKHLVRFAPARHPLSSSVSCALLTRRPVSQGPTRSFLCSRGSSEVGGCTPQSIRAHSQDRTPVMVNQEAIPDQNPPLGDCHELPLSPFLDGTGEAMRAAGVTLCCPESRQGNSPG